MATVCFSINLRNRGISQYTNFRFSSMGNWKGQVLGSIPGVGICGIGEEYDTDNGADIDGSFKLFANNLGYPGPKTIRNMTVQYAAEGDLILTYTADKKKTRSKTLSPFYTAMEPQAQQVTGARDVYGTVFSFEIENDMGGKFTVFSIYATPINKNIGLSRVR